MLAGMGSRRHEEVLQPVTGRALPLHRGEVLRITQLEGGQCVDFNAFNLHDYKEHMSVGHSRQAGLHLREGDVLLSNPPRHRPMIFIAHMSPSCVSDTLGARCDAVLFEEIFGFAFHTNCQDTFSEAIRAYDLTPDDVHDSFNMFMNTKWDEDGAWWIDWNTGRKGDRVDLLACMDTLSVPIVCGSGDVAPTSNFFFKPIRIEIFQSSDESLAKVQELDERFAAAKSRKGPDSYKVRAIRVERELTPNPNYRPEFPSHPLARETIAVLVEPRVAAWMQQMTSSGFATDVADALRRTVMARVIRENAARKRGLGSAQRRFPQVPRYRQVE